MTATAAIPIGRSLMRNSLSLVGGRLLLSVARLTAAVGIARLAGSQSFGEYVLLMGVVAIFEWLIDFGQTDIAVKQVCGQPASAAATFGALARLKQRTALLLVPTMPLAVWAFGYAPPLVAAAACGAVGLAAYGLLQPDRAALKVNMRLDIDIAAEIGGVLVMLPLVVLAALGGGQPAWLLAAYSVSRIVHALVIRGFVRRHALRPTETAASAADLFRAALPLGIAGLLVALYDGLAPIMLSKLMTFRDVAAYGAASRFALPVLTIVQAVGGAFFPVLARQASDRPRLAETQAAALWLSLMLAGGLAVGLYGAADALVAIIGTTMDDAVPALRLMCCLVVARAVTTAMSPLIVIGGRQDRGLFLTLASLAAQAAAIPLLVPLYGIKGVVIGYLVVELVVGVLPVSLLGLSATGIGLDWTIPARIVVAAFAASAVVAWTPIAGSFTAGIAAGLLFVGFAVLSGAASLGRVRATVGLMRSGRDER